MKRLHAALILLTFAVLHGPLHAVAADDGQPESNSVQAPIYFTVEPQNVLPALLLDPSQPVKTITGYPLKIRGATGTALFGKTLRVTVTPLRSPPAFSPEAESKCPQDADATVVASGPARHPPPTVLNVVVSGSGEFETIYTPRVDGEYEVVVEGGQQRGAKSFEADTPDVADECEEIPRQQIEQAATELRQTLCKTVDLIEAKIKQLPASPAKEEFTRRYQEFQQAMRETPPCDDPPPWINGVDHIQQLRRIAPHTRKATAGLTKQFKSWFYTARRANTNAPQALAKLTVGNIACDQMDIIANALKFCDFYLGLLVTPGKWLIEWGKENVPTKLVGMIPAVKRTPALKEGIESAWKGATTFFEPERHQGRISVSGVKGYERDLGKQKMAFNLASYAFNRVFEVFCQQFQGPISASMSAEFYENGMTWWTYTTTIAGDLILRYPKSARGSVIPLTGEFVGNATRFKSWDNAVPVLFPKLAMGTVFRTLRIEPLSMSDFGPLRDDPLKENKPGGLDLPDPNPITTSIEQGGLITRFVLTPAFFRVPVRGELRDNTLRLELQPAALDFDDRRVKVVQILLPVLSLWPTVNDYALPYKGAHFILTRAMNDGPAEFTVKSQSNTLSIEREFKRERRTTQNKGVYSLSVKACNPSCSGSPQ